MVEKGFIPFDECVYICSLKKKSAPVLTERTVKSSGSISNSQRMLTETNESGAIAKIKT